MRSNFRDPEAELDRRVRFIMARTAADRAAAVAAIARTDADLLRQCAQHGDRVNVSPNADDPIGTWQTEFRARVAKGMRANDAIKAIDREMPGLRHSYLAAYNAAMRSAHRR